MESRVQLQISNETTCMRKFFQRGLANIDGDIGKLETPHERITFRTYFSITVLSAVIIFLMVKIILNDQKDKVNDLREQMVEFKTECRRKSKQDSIEIEKLKVNVDSFRTAFYGVVKEMYENRLETVKQNDLEKKHLKELLKK